MDPIKDFSITFCGNGGGGVSFGVALKFLYDNFQDMLITAACATVK